MATAMHHGEHRNTADVPKEKEKAPEYIPDIIEERRKDSEGRITLNKFACGKLLGKVKTLYIIHKCIFTELLTTTLPHFSLFLPFIIIDREDLLNAFLGYNWHQTINMR